VIYLVKLVQRLIRAFREAKLSNRERALRQARRQKKRL
jgi:hypothetical protein